MKNDEILKLFKAEKALLSGHFILSSGLHSPNYLQCALVLQKPWIAQKLCAQLARKVSHLKPQTVIGPALGGVVVSYEMARALKVRSIFAERVGGEFTLRRGFQIKKNERVLIAEDVITTGKSVYELIDLVEHEGAQVVGVAAIVDRSGGAAVFSQNLHALLEITVKTYKPDQCPDWLAKIPATKPGSRSLK